MVALYPAKLVFIIFAISFTLSPIFAAISLLTNICNSLFDSSSSSQTYCIPLIFEIAFTTLFPSSLALIKSSVNNSILKNSPLFLSPRIESKDHIFIVHGYTRSLSLIISTYSFIFFIFLFFLLLSSTLIFAELDSLPVLILD